MALVLSAVAIADLERILDGVSISRVCATLSEVSKMKFGVTAIEDCDVLFVETITEESSLTL